MQIRLPRPPAVWRLLRPRRTQPGEAERIATFWTWWVSVGAEGARAAIGNDAALIAVLDPRVIAVHPGLAWDVVAGPTEAPVLMVSPEGAPELRAIARRWLVAAPEPGTCGDWGYTDHRPPVPDPEDVTLTLPGGEDLVLHDIVVTARQEGSRFDVTLYHPTFDSLSERDRSAAAYRVLDSTLGETDAEIWVGTLRATDLEPRDGFGLIGLRAAVRDLKEKFVDQDGQPAWSVMHAESPAGPVEASAMVPLHPATAPHLTRHMTLYLPFRSKNDDALPDVDEMALLSDTEDSLRLVLGASGRVVAHETSAGVRLLHLYIDPEADLLPRILDVLEKWPHGRTAQRQTDDPGWDAVEHLRI